MKIARLTGCKNFVGKRKQFIFNAFIDLNKLFKHLIINIATAMKLQSVSY